MDEENILVEEVNENDLKEEWQKKILVVLVTLAVLAGTYYFTSLSNNKTKNNAVVEQTVVNNAVVQTVKQANPNDAKTIVVNKPENNTVNPETKAVENNPDINKTEQTESNSPVGIKPTSKALVAKSALLAAGKSDPFSGNTTTTMSPEKLKAFLPKYIGKNPLSIPPSLNGLPSISSLPSLNLPNSGLMPGKVYMTPLPEVKGFIGNKVILSINGISESVKVNQWFQGIKVVKIDPATMSVKFIQDHKIVTKNIRSLN